MIFRLRNLLVLILVMGGNLASAQQGELADPWLAEPVSDTIFESYLDFFDYDKQLPFATEVIDKLEDDGATGIHLSFQSTKGERVFANWFEPVGDHVGNRSVIVLHGGQSRGKGMVEIWSSMLARDGWNVFAIDMKYYGERATDLMTTFSTEEKDERLYNNPPIYLAWIIQTVQDIRRSFDFLIAERGADPDKIVLNGVSRGGVVAMIAGAVEKRLAGIAITLGGHHSSPVQNHYAAACPANYIGHISPTPLFMLNGTHDIIFPKETQLDHLQRIAKEPKTIRWSEIGHSIPTEDDVAATLQWMRGLVE